MSTFSHLHVKMTIQSVISKRGFFVDKFREDKQLMRREIKLFCSQNLSGHLSDTFYGGGINFRTHLCKIISSVTTSLCLGNDKPVTYITLVCVTPRDSRDKLMTKTWQTLFMRKHNMHGVDIKYLRNKCLNFATCLFSV